ncbi:MAG: AAA family ATPase [Bacteroidales bacterium]|nr:AAA family ATPase [Bacteroidales bacterium]
MELKNIKIRNFRCFKKYSITFGERATVLFGKNGTGKSTLINAIHKALSFIMDSDKIYSREKVKVKGKLQRKLIDVKSITLGNPYLKVERFSKVGDNNNTDSPLIEIMAEAELQPKQSLYWNMSAYITNFELRPSGFKDAFRKFYEWQQTTGQWPVLAYYSDCFPHKEDNKKRVNKQKIAHLRNFGYLDWNDVEGCMKEWIGRLESNLVNIRNRSDLVEKLLRTQSAQEGVDNSEAINTTLSDIMDWKLEVNTIEECIINFCKNLLPGEEMPLEIVGINLHSQSRDLCVITKEGKEISFIHLPAGYKRLLSIVMDLAFRCYIINKGNIESAKGIVIIDEIDLHLHPELEKAVMPRLIEVFPYIQFIVSTHAIEVLTSLKTTDGRIKIVAMERGEEQPEEKKDIYGIDASTGLQEIMGVRRNGVELQRLIDRLAYMRLKDYHVQADNMQNYILQLNLISAEELNHRVAKKLMDLKK